MSNLTFAVELLAFGLGIAFLVWAYRNEGVGVRLSKVVGYIIAIAAVLSIVCTSVHSVRYGKGYFSSQSTPPHLIMKKQMITQKYPTMLRHIQRGN